MTDAMVGLAGPCAKPGRTERSMAIRDLTWFDVVRRNGRVRGDGPALVYEGQRLTHGDLLARAEALAGGLAAAGLGRGDRVAIVAQNRPEIVDLVAAAARLGAIVLPVNWRLGADEVAYVLEDGAPAVVVAEAEYAAPLASLRERLTSVRGWFGFDEPLPGFRPYDELTAGTGQAPEVDVASDDALVIIHTAAVGGQPRGAVLSHGNLVAHNLQLALAWALGPGDAALCGLPLFHISGLGLALAVQQAGGASVLMRRFEPAAAVDAIAREQVTAFCEFAPMLGQVLDAAAGREGDLASLRAVWGLDAPETIARFEAACPEARFWAGYGQSETSGYVSFSPHAERPGSAGRPAALARLEIVDEEDRPVPAGTVGEIVVRGPLVFGGYWGRERDTAEAFRAGWHHTGDMGRFDEDGYLFYAGRSPAKELIKSGGENVYPAEVERALREHPGIEAAIVLGVPDPRWGEAVKAVCVRRAGGHVEEAELIAFVGERIARFKRPKFVVFVDALPTSSAGAIDRAAVKAEHGAA